MRPYLGPPRTNSCQMWCVRVFHHVLLKYCHENAEMQKRKFDDVTLQYSHSTRELDSLALFELKPTRLELNKSHSEIRVNFHSFAFRE